MSRLSEFRAWDNKLNRWVPEDNNIMINRYGEWVADNHIYLWAYRKEDISIEWWTGHYDKNKKKIFDGDIYKLHIVPTGGPDYWVTDVIEWSELFTLEYDDYSSGYEWPCYPSKIEVIGNIRENPELMKVENV
jgi:uncharacterized phage protein (TIGR01671 family)